VIETLEKVIPPRWRTPFMTTKRIVGFVVLILAATLFMPIPLSNIIPGALIMLIALAYLEEGGILLCIALSAITILEAWATIRGADFLFLL
jgi:hypothetical protein